MLGSPLVDIFSELRSRHSLAERWEYLTAKFASLGFDQINYAVLNVAEEGRETAPVTQYSTMRADWIDHYLSNRLDLHDPHVRFVREFGYQPYFFASEMASQLEEKEASVINQASEAGLKSQISIIFPAAASELGPTGGMTIGSSLSAGDFGAAMRGNEQWLMAAAMLFHSLSLPEVRRAQMNIQPLSPRERDCLKYLADGLRIGRIAQRLAISEVTVELHLRNARRKLGASTTPQAIARAIFAGELTA